MWNSKIRQKLFLQPVLAALCTAVLFSLLYFFRELYPFGNGSVMITDMYSQYVPLLYRFYDVVIGKKNLFLDFSISGGANLYTDTINEVINPFNYVLFLFGRDMIYKAVNIILLMYVAAAAASINLFLIKIFPKNKKWNLILSTCYAMSGYMAYNYQVIKWMLFPVIFPLFCLALRRLIKEGKGGLYAILLCYQLDLSIQLGFMTLLFTLFSSGIYFYCCVKKEVRQTLMCRLGVFTILGLLLSGAVLVPNIMILLSSSRAGENLSYINIMKRHGFDDLFERIFQVAHPVLLAILICLIIRWKMRGKTEENENSAERKFLILLNAFLWLTVLLQPANLIWHMGSYVCFPVRYAYMALLSGICLIKLILSDQANMEDVKEIQGAEETKCTENSVKKDNDIVFKFLLPACSIILWAAACIFTFVWNDRIVQAFSTLAISLVCPKETVNVCIILLLFFFAALCAVMSVYNRQWLLLVSAVCGVCFWMFILLPKDYDARILNETAYEVMTEQAAVTYDSVFHHVKSTPELPPNASLVNRQSSLTGYLPTGNQIFQNTMEELGYMVRWVATQDVGGTAISDKILSEGMLFYANASELELKGTSVLERQEEIGEFAAGKSCLKRISCSEKEKDENGAICLRISGEQTVYLDPAMTADSYGILINGEEVEIPEAGAYYAPHRIVELGTYADEEIKILIVDKSGNPLSVENMEIAMLDVKEWENALDINGSESARLLSAQEVAADTADGSINVVIENAEAGQTVFLPMTALNGWKCILNGKDADVSNVFGFLGIAVENGHNEIKLKFISPGLWVGSILSFFGIVGLAAGVLFELSRHKKICISDGAVRKKSTVGNTAIRVMSWIYCILFVGGLLMVYIIPAAGLAVYIVMKILRLKN